MSVPVRRATDGTSGADAELQPISVEQTLHHVEEVQGVGKVVRNRRAHHTTESAARARSSHWR